MDEEDEVSWRLIARVMPVIAADGMAVGRVTHTLGDPDHDIFDGVAFRRNLWSPLRMAAAAQIARVTTRAVHLSVPAAVVEAEPGEPEDKSRGRRRNWRRK